MATTLMPLDPATSPQRASRLLDISAQLLPDEIVAKRRARRMRGQVVILLLVFVALLGSWYGFAAYQKQMAQQELDAVAADARNLQKLQSGYADVVNIQNETTTIGKQLNALLANDLRWATLFDTVRSTGSGSGIVVVGVNGQLVAGSAGVANTPVLPSVTNVKAVGELTVTGSAPNKTALARYVDALGGLKVVANPYLSSATESQGRVQFSLKVDVTADALGGRFSKKAGGK